MTRPAAAQPATLVVTLGQHSDRGRATVNQDFHGACIPGGAQLEAKGIVVALADGIGSSPVSHVASQAAVRAVLDDYYCTSDAWSVKRSMQRVLAATNSWLHAQTQRGPYRHDHDRGYVCALSTLVIKGGTAHVFHVGDVRIYRRQGRSFERLTEDHRVWVAGGQSYLSRAMGFHPRLELDYQSLPVEPGDLFLLACDGVHEHLDEKALATLVDTHRDDLTAAARAIVAAAYERGSQDNLSVQLLRVDAVPAHDAGEARQLLAGLPVPPLPAARAEFDGYRIERELHGSSRSHIYLATELATGEAVALKLPSIDLAADAAYLDRFMLEEWIARRIDNAHVLKPRPRLQAPSRLYVAMEYVSGCTLAQWMRDHPTPDLETVRGIVEQIARGLQAFHRLEMLHQDLRPENVMIDTHGTVKIIDFGSTRVAGLADSAPPGAREAVLGTLQYTAPEYFVGEAGSERSDQFSLGVIAYQMLTGRLPYGARVSSLRTRADQQRLVYESALDDRRAVPAWLDAVLARAVHPMPFKRYDALSEFVHDLRHPNLAYLARTRAPLIERQPLRFWKALSLVLALAVLVLLGMLHAGSHIVDARQFPAKFSPVTPKASS